MSKSKISKHLMLLFNRACYFFSIKKPIFQNISCYCLTDRTVYFTVFALLFQNISCYCLTIQVSEYHPSSFAFQNISCYCLTNDFTSFFNGLFKKTTILCTFPLFFPSAPSIYCFSKKVHISAISNTFSGNHLVKFCTFKYQ